jgi:hypothetical protein
MYGQSSLHNRPVLARRGSKRREMPKRRRNMKPASFILTRSGATIWLTKSERGYLFSGFPVLVVGFIGPLEPTSFFLTGRFARPVPTTCEISSGALF